MGNAVAALILLVLAIVLWYAHWRGIIRNTTLDALDRIASVMAFLTAMTLLVWPYLVPLFSESLDYQVRVQDKSTGYDVPNAVIRIEMGNGIPPQYSTTDGGGLARFFIKPSYVGKPGRLVVEAVGYKRFELNIDLRADTPPLIIQLDSDS